MSASTPSPRAAAPSLSAWVGGLLASEWTKFRSLRSTYWALLIAAVTAVGGSAALAGPSGRQGSAFDPLASIFVGWLEYPVLAVGILGVMTITSEHSTGQIRTTFAAVPQRLAVLGAKTAVLGAVVLVLGELLAFGSFFLSQALVSGGPGLSLSGAGVLRGVLAGGFTLFVIAVTGFALGVIVRHTAGAVAVLPAVVYMPLLFLALPAPWDNRVGKFTLLMAAYQATSLHPQAGLLSPAWSLVVLVAWPVTLLLIGCILVTHRDA